MSRCLQYLVSAFLGILTVSLCPSPALAREAIDNLLRMPVFFLTDRNFEPSKKHAVDFGVHRKYIGDCKHDPFMGTAWCVVENVDHKVLDAHLKELGWAQAEKGDKPGAFEATLIKDKTFEEIEKTFYDKVHEKALLTEDKNIFVFAHGYKNSFSDGLGTAAKLAYNAERPLVLYSWPSVGKLRSYDSDENNVEWSQEHFNDFLTQLEKVCTQDPSVKVRLFAHSMGNRLVVRAAPLLREKSFVLETALICPDVDNGLVRHYARRYLSVKGTTEIRLYMSRHDRALALSQLLHGGYTRFGEQADSIGNWVSNVMNTKNAKNVADETAASDAEFADRLSKTKERMQTIDFSAIDTGLVGHTIPEKLICNMSFHGTPGPGLRFVEEESGQRSKISQMFSKMTKLKETDDTTGHVLYVVSENEKSKRHPPENKAMTDVVAP